MRTCIILNPEAGSARQHDQLRRLLEQQPEIACWETAEEGDAEAFVERAAAEGMERIGIAGGDGTINGVVNGVLRSDASIQLGVLPLGTGNDLARTLGVSDDLRDALAFLQVGEVQALDAIRLEHGGTTCYGVNVAAGGFSGAVDENLSPQTKAQWGPLAYLFGAANALPDLRDYDVLISYDEDPPEDIDVFNVIVANGRTAGGGRMVAPMANPQDGWLDVVVVEPCPLSQMARIGAQLMRGHYQENPCVHHRRVKRVHVAADPGMWFNIDGELLTKEPITFSVVPDALSFVVGENYRAEPEPGGS